MQLVIELVAHGRAVAEAEVCSLMRSASVGQLINMLPRPHVIILTYWDRKVLLFVMMIVTIPLSYSACSYLGVASEMEAQPPSARLLLHASALNPPFQAPKLCDACGAVERHDVKSVSVLNQRTFNSFLNCVWKWCGMTAHLLLRLRKKIFHSDTGERKRLRFDLTIVSSCTFAP